jgi:hypothetical protein
VSAADDCCCCSIASAALKSDACLFHALLTVRFLSHDVSATAFGAAAAAAAALLVLTRDPLVQHHQQLRDGAYKAMHFVSILSHDRPAAAAACAV